VKKIYQSSSKIKIIGIEFSHDRPVITQNMAKEMQSPFDKEEDL